MASAMSGFELDHVFVCAEDPSAAESALARTGLAVSRRTTHHGQGTSNACVSFENAYLELLFAQDERDLKSALVAPLGLWERLHWKETGACPFGIALRTPERAGVLPVPTWQYKARYFPPGASLPIATPEFSHREPLVFFLNRAPTEETARPSLPRVTNLVVSVPGPAGVGEALPRLSSGIVLVEPGSEYLLRLVCDGADSSGTADLRPAVPLKVER